MHVKGCNSVKFCTTRIIGLGKNQNGARVYFSVGVVIYIFYRYMPLEFALMQKYVSAKIVKIVKKFNIGKKM